MNSQYHVALIDPETGDTLDILTAARFRRLRYSRAINADPMPEFSITLPAADTAALYFENVDLIAEVYRANNINSPMQVEGSYFIRYVNYQPNEDGEDYLIAKGYALEDLLRRRKLVIEDDTASAPGYSNKNGYLSKFDFGDNILNSIVDYQLISPAVNTYRAFPNLTTAATGNLGLITFMRKQEGDSVLQVLQEIAIQSGVDFRIVRTSGKNLQFQTGQYFRERTLINYPSGEFILLSTNRGNVRNPNFEIDRTKEITAALVLGDGPPDARTKRLVIAPRAYDSPYNLIEEVIDANENGTELDALFATGSAFLNDNEKEIYKYDFEIDTSYPDLTYNVDWFLGDKISAEFKTFNINMRITGVTIEITSDETIELEVRRY